MQRVLRLERVLARVEGDKAAASTHAGRLVAQHVELVHRAKLLDVNGGF